MKNKSDVFQFVMEHAKLYAKESFFKKRFPEHYCEILKCGFPDDFKFQQKLYHYLMDDFNLKLGICPVCGKRCKFKSFIFGYRKHCSKSCSNHDINVIEKSKNTSIKKFGKEYYTQTNEYKDRVKKTYLENYGVESYFQTDDYKSKSKETCISKYGVNVYSKTKECRDRIKKTCLEKYGVQSYTQTDEYKKKSKESYLLKYGVENYTQTDEYKIKVKNTCLSKYGVESYSKTNEYRERIKNTCFERYGMDSYSNTEEFKDRFKNTCFERYGTYYSNTEEFKNKIYITKKKNNSFNTSNIEQEFKNYLMFNNIEFEYQYKSELYPFACDFYIPEYDLYIEIQGNWTHGGHPYDESSIEDINKLNIWKNKKNRYYDIAVKVWSKSDVLKRETARKNNLNYLEVFSIDVNDVIKKFINTISILKSSYE